MLQQQEETVKRWVQLIPNDSFLDVGGGHGQLAVPLAEDGFRGTVTGSAPECAKRLQLDRLGDLLSFTRCSVIALPFPDRSFSPIISIRLLPHCTQWKKLIQELCRVADQHVIVDYPTSQSINALSSLMFGLKKSIEKNTRPYHLFTHREIKAEFDSNGFELQERHNEFFWPMVLHRAMKNRAISTYIEKLARLCGLTALLGSPTLTLYRRKEV